ncbi:hypothetical protein GQ53DRAFT_94332 [Thozetella sp. PMI_491]|nr:hypothetical protein GQ53DRAFT_94332 [Thozetella sp. PMI_491]
MLNRYKPETSRASKSWISLCNSFIYSSVGLYLSRSSLSTLTTCLNLLILGLCYTASRYYLALYA